MNEPVLDSDGNPVIDDITKRPVLNEFFKFIVGQPLRLFANPTRRDIKFSFNRVPVLRKDDIKVSVTDVNGRVQ